jgi:glycosyltransferase involved in cell wall biosynthesis
VLLSRNVFNKIDLDTSVWLALALGLILIAFVLRSIRNYRAMSEICPLAGGNPAPDCMVVIPARNEEGSVGAAVRSLPPDSVIVVDDFSDDKTGDVAREAGAGVLPAPPLLGGAVGKSNACMEGARVLTSRWILFADADTRFEVGFLDAVVAAGEAGQIDFLSVYLKPEFRTLAESTLSPYAVALYFCGINPRADPASAFNGQCLLVKRSPYEFVGGHKALLSSVCEDLKLAALAERHRLKFAVMRAPRLGWVRIHPGDFERNACRFALGNLGRGLHIAFAAAVWALWLPALVFLLLRNQFLAAAVWAFVPSLLLRPWYGWSRAILAPLAIYAILPLLFHGALAAVTNRHFEWKGRVV